MRARRVVRAVVFAALAIVEPAVAFESGLPTDVRPDRDDPVRSVKELTFRVEKYKPGIDAGLSGDARPYEQVFGSGGMWGGRLELAKSWPRSLGTPGLGLSIGYYSASGHGVYRDGTGTLQRSGDDAALYVIPISAFATYRLDEPLRRLGLPLAPYARLGLERYTWITTATDHSSRSGGTSGFSGTLGVALFLDDLDRTLSNEMYRESGIRHVFLTVDATKALIDNFGAGGGMNLSSVGLSFALGLGFTY
jgi:hypothetical protein